MRLDVLEEADGLHRSELRVVDLHLAHDGDLQYADRSVFDAAELVGDEGGHRLAEVALRQTLEGEHLGDLSAADPLDAVEALERLRRHGHDGDDGGEAVFAEDVVQVLVVTERVDQGGHCKGRRVEHATTSSVV